jgi:hypothetical protein
MAEVTVVIEYDEDAYPEGVYFGFGMTTEDLPDGEITAVAFGNALADEDEP